MTNNQQLEHEIMIAVHKHSVNSHTRKQKSVQVGMLILCKYAPLPDCLKQFFTFKPKRKFWFPTFIKKFIWRAL